MQSSVGTLGSHSHLLNITGGHIFALPNPKTFDKQNNLVSKHSSGGYSVWHEIVLNMQHMYPHARLLEQHCFLSNKDNNEKSTHPFSADVR